LRKLLPGAGLRGCMRIEARASQISVGCRSSDVVCSTRSRGSAAATRELSKGGRPVAESCDSVREFQPLREEYVRVRAIFLDIQIIYTTCSQLVVWTYASYGVRFTPRCRTSRVRRNTGPQLAGAGSRAKGDQERMGNPRAGLPEREGRRNERMNQSASDAGGKCTRPWRR
jgi:hypothetical protein